MTFHHSQAFKNALQTSRRFLYSVCVFLLFSKRSTTIDDSIIEHNEIETDRSAFSKHQIHVLNRRKQLLVLLKALAAFGSEKSTKVCHQNWIFFETKQIVHDCINFHKILWILQCSRWHWTDSSELSSIWSFVEFSDESINRILLVLMIIRIFLSNMQLIDAFCNKTKAVFELAANRRNSCMKLNCFWSFLIDCSEDYTRLFVFIWMFSGLRNEICCLFWLVAATVGNDLRNDEAKLLFESSSLCGASISGVEW